MLSWAPVHLTAPGYSNEDKLLWDQDAFVILLLWRPDVLGSNLSLHWETRSAINVCPDCKCSKARTDFSVGVTPHIMLLQFTLWENSEFCNWIHQELKHSGLKLTLLPSASIPGRKQTPAPCLAIAGDPDCSYSVVLKLVTGCWQHSCTLHSPYYLL